MNTSIPASIASGNGPGARTDNRAAWIRAAIGGGLMLALVGAVFAWREMGDRPDPVTGCLNNSMLREELEGSVRGSLRVPDSMKAMTFRASRPDPDGTQEMFMGFAAQLGARGNGPHMVAAIIDTNGCQILNWNLVR